MYKDVDGKHVDTISYRQFIKELADRTGNSYQATKALCDAMSDTIIDFLSAADDETIIILRPLKGLRIRAIKQLEPQRYQPSTREPYPRKIKICVKATAEKPIRSIDIPDDQESTMV